MNFAKRIRHTLQNELGSPSFKTNSAHHAFKTNSVHLTKRIRRPLQNEFGALFKTNSAHRGIKTNSSHHGFKTISAHHGFQTNSAHHGFKTNSVHLTKRLRRILPNEFADCHRICFEPVVGRIRFAKFTNYGSRLYQVMRLVRVFYLWSIRLR